MTQIGGTLKIKKRDRIKISNLDEFKDALLREGYIINYLIEEDFKVEFKRIFKLNNTVAERLYSSIKDNEVSYKVNNIENLIDYIEKILLFDNEHKKFCRILSNIKRLNIDRIEYERETSIQDNVEDILKDIEEVKKHISINIYKNQKKIIENLEKEIDKDYIYGKDIELLKKIFLYKKEGLIEKYNKKTKVKSISIEIPEKFDCKYIQYKKGSVEYHEYLTNNIPRMKRLIKNLSKYMKVSENEEGTFKINQSNALQDSINIAVSIFDNKKFKAISGSNNIENYCVSPLPEKTTFKSIKINKLGKVGIGYNRVNDSEKKIFEEIHKQIEEKVLKDEGDLILYSKWEPCSSCYYVISQFCNMHPNIKVQVNYSKEYGEK
ncbi:MAG: hypothetical protein KIC47_13275 [Clostridium sp.]|nr:hypothetical protein [Clostridium sp.]